MSTSITQRLKAAIPDLVLLLAVAGGVYLGLQPPYEPEGGAAGIPPSSAAADRFNTALDMQQLMALVLEPTVDVLWDSAGWILDMDEGYEELYPTTDEEWEAVLVEAATVVEIGNTLALPSRALDDDAWLIYAGGLSQAGLRAMDAIEAQDKEAFFQAGADLYSVCTACHQAYSPEINSRFVTE